MTTTPQPITRSRVYRAPDGVRAAHYAGFAQRVTGFVIDWAICFYIPFIFAGIASNYVWHVASDGSDASLGVFGTLWLVVIAACVIGYYTFFMSRGRTIGMRVAQTQIVDPSTGLPPSRARSVVRGLLLFLFGTSFFMLLNVVFSDHPPGGLAGLDLALAVVAAAMFFAGVWGYLWMFFDPRFQPAADRIAGTVVIDKYVTIPKTPTRET